MLFKATDLCKQYNDQIILDQVSFVIQPKDKIAIIGRNGCGKTTLMKIMMELEYLDSGTLDYNSNLKLGYLDQKHLQTYDCSVEEILLEPFNRVKSLQQKLQTMQQKMSNKFDEQFLAEYQKVNDQFEALGGFRYEHEMKAMFYQFNFQEKDLSRNIKTFSGGEKTRIALVSLLLSKPDVLLLDEPTNHLDLKTISWLENYLSQYPKAVIIISHDREFINKSSQRIWELEDGKLTTYAGSYENYLEQKNARLIQNHRDFVRQQKEIEHLKSWIERYRHKKATAKRVKVKERYLNQLDIIKDSKTKEKSFSPRFTISQKTGKLVLECEDLSIGYGKELVNISENIYAKERVFILGANGSGKSSFLKTLVGQIKPMNGDFLFGHGVLAGYFEQELAHLTDDNLEVLDAIWNEVEDFTYQQVRQLLATFLFTDEDVYKPLSKLSQGEKVRLALLKLMLGQYNVLLLDEPTNHLDIYHKEALEKALMDYEGTMICVSHDRYFIKKMASRLLVFQDGKALKYEDIKDALEVQIEVKENSKKQKASKQYNNKKREIQKIERKINKLEKEKELLINESFKEEVYSDYQKLQENNRQQEIIMKALDLLYEDWDNLQNNIVD